ncbi:MAG: cobalamin B12-binding domain-containing protein, partial [Candidatus Sumerlaeota bacterium]|nr:cobalamin B12-binding domain-containing protein [Candidatus Sumerlaeota bacterium]
MTEKSRTVLGAAIGQCVHVAGLDHFLRLCETQGWRAVMLGPAVSIDRLLEAVAREKPDLVAVSYRLTSEDAAPLLRELRRKARALPPPRPRWVFGGTPPVAKVARECGLFACAFDGTEPAGTVEAWVQGQSPSSRAAALPDDLVSHIEAKKPFPLIRHHYGEPDLKTTVDGARL